MFSRRQFLHAGAVTGSALLGLGDLSMLGRLPRVSAEEARLDPKVVRLAPDIEPLVQLLEETPRERLLEEVADRIRKGLSYRELLAALNLAGVRNVEPRPTVGFKFHAVLVVNSAHLASLSAPDRDRWLPIFWALDYFKSAQAQNIRERNGWRMPPVNESAVPPARKARQALIDALNNWDESAADAAVAGLVRTAGVAEVFDIFWRYAPRDFRSIGHKIIFAANSRRTLECIGWQHAEPILRSLAYAILAHSGQNPARQDDPADRPGRRNVELAGKIRPDWPEGKLDAGATAELLATLRQGSDAEACDQVVALLNRGVAPQSIWDALLTGAGELLMRQPGIVALHAVTSSNAIRYAYEASGDDATRRYLLLQNAAFLPLFRQAMQQRGGKLRELAIDRFEPAPLAGGGNPVEEIFADVSRDRAAAAAKTLTWLKQQPQPQELINAARVLIFLKGTDSHDYKFSSAVLEDYYHVSPGWRDRLLAASMFQLRGSGGPDNALVGRIRAALG